MAGFAAQQKRSGGSAGPAPQRTVRHPDRGAETRETAGAETSHANLRRRSTLVVQRALQIELNRRPQVVAQAQLAHALSFRATAPPKVGTASVSGPVVQRYFSAPHGSETNLVWDLVRSAFPHAIDAFIEAANSEEEIDLYTWLADHLNMTMHDVYDWDFGLVHGRLLMLGEAEVPGTNDIPSDANADLHVFRQALAGYSLAELRRLYDMLGERGAPHDNQRRKILQEQAAQTGQTGSTFPQEEKREEQIDISEHEETGMDVVLPTFVETEGSGTETEGSDTEDERQFLAHKSRQKSSKRRLKREAKLLKPSLYEKRMTTLHRVFEPDEEQPSKKRERPRETTKKRKSQKLTLAQDARPDDPEDLMRSTEDTEGFRKSKSDQSSEEALNKAIFSGGKRPKKDALYRKETNFNHPGVPVGPRAEVPERPTEQETQDLAQLNALIDLGVPIALAEKAVTSKFVVAQYRGLFYARGSFNQRARARHRGLDELDQPVFASGALASSPLGTASYYYLYGAENRSVDRSGYQRRVAQEAQRIHEALQALRGVPPDESVRKGVGRATENFKPQSMADIGTHFYSQDYDAYHRALGEAVDRGEDDEPGLLDPLFKDLPGSGNPKVSTGDVPVHAGRYAYGLKPYEGHEAEVLEPDYDKQGKPKHPYSGQVYVSIHPLSDYGPDGPEQLIELQREHRINIAQVILPERESPFEGMIPENRVKHRMAAKFLNFNKDYKQVYGEKYGLTPELFQAFRTALLDTQPGTEPRTFVESLLSNFLALHSEVRAIEAAMQQAREQGARLVYRTGKSSFGFEPAPLKGEPSSSGRKLSLPELLKTLVGDVREESASGEPSQSAEDRIDKDYDVTEISGVGFACYIRSLVTAAAKLYGLLPDDQIEKMVDIVQDHLSAQGLREEGEDIDAGGLVAAEVRRALAELLAFDPEIHIVQEREMGGLTEYVATTGRDPVYLLYTPGHFSLLNRRDPGMQEDLNS